MDKLFFLLSTNCSTWKWKPIWKFVEKLVDFCNCSVSDFPRRVVGSNLIKVDLQKVIPKNPKCFLKEKKNPSCDKKYSNKRNVGYSRCVVLRRCLWGDTYMNNGKHAHFIFDGEIHF